ncbi:HNH endonuclease signature motif containing protein [Mycolicibacter virginiensis]|uniref:HNH endonuclease n=1 Tax=Mycolicibacter virginiensis TaxID=1795032 RepID=A0A9X7IJH0_9MYCO|nr:MULTISPECIES: HNH endonuclease signature motif containing protein [Mycobacteriaceae]PQM50397.1 HNH endonuclease [Mycolicibacter virginiensis]ULP49632.1 HNH endonuclease [Mycolicibacter virginiensis]
MFDTALPSLEGIRARDDAGLVDAMQAAARLQAAFLARVFAAAAELYHRRLAEQQVAAREIWAIDGWEAVAAEIAAAQGISRGRAAGQLRLGLALAERLPKLEALFAAGVVDYQVVAAVVHRTELMIDPDAIPRMDRWLERNAPRWGKWSRARIVEAVDYWVQVVEPAAVREARILDQSRHILVTPQHSGLAEIFGEVRTADALAFDHRLDELAGTVCPADPRTKQQRRADALSALTAGAAIMACECGSPDCPATTGDASVGAVMIHVMAEQATLEGRSDVPGYVPGFGGLQADAVRTIAKSAKLRTVRHPRDAAPEAGYRPSAALADFIRCRDLTCRFPGCGRPAEVADIDHTVPWPLGPTHPSNLKLLCRLHHLLKTFWVGPTGWRDRQEPDGTVIWTAPTGHTYVTKPGGALYFPQLANPTGELDLPEWSPTGSRGVMMPTRRRTRAQDRAYRIWLERNHNQERIADAAIEAAAAEHARRIAAANDPPPF